MFSAGASGFGSACFLLEKFVFGTGAKCVFASGDAILSVSIVYIAVALAFAIVLGLVESLLCKNVSVDLEEDTDEEKQG